MGLALALPKAFETPWDVLFYSLNGLVGGWVCGLPIGFILGGLIGTLNRRLRLLRPVSLVVSAFVGLLCGAAVSFVLLWHRRDVDEHFGWVRTDEEYARFALTLFPLVMAMSSLACLALGWGIELVIRLPGSFRLRVGKGAMAGAAAGCLTGLWVLGIIVFVLGPALKRFGGW